MTSIWQPATAPSSAYQDATGAVHLKVGPVTLYGTIDDLRALLGAWGEALDSAEFGDRNLDHGAEYQRIPVYEGF